MNTVTRLRKMADDCDRIADQVLRPQTVIYEWRDKARFLRDLADKIESNPEFAFGL